MSSTANISSHSLSSNGYISVVIRPQSSFSETTVSSFSSDSVPSTSKNPSVWSTSLTTWISSSSCWPVHSCSSSEFSSLGSFKNHWLSSPFSEASMDSSFSSWTSDSWSWDSSCPNSSCSNSSCSSCSSTIISSSGSAYTKANGERLSVHKRINKLNTDRDFFMFFVSNKNIH